MAQAVKVGNLQISSKNLSSKSAAALGVSSGSSGSSSKTSGAATAPSGWVDPTRSARDTASRQANNVRPATEDDTTAAPTQPIVPTAQQQPASGTQTGQLAYNDALKNLNAGGLTGNNLANAQNALANSYGMPAPNKFSQMHQQLQQSGAAPAAPGAAMAQVQSAKPYEPDQATAIAAVTGNPQIDSLLQTVSQQILNPQEQTTSLMADYKKLYKQSGLGDINQELIDADTVINGTEQDIRREITAAGGFGTESQVQAMSLSRNKGLLKRYNQLVQMQTNAQNQLNTMIGLDSQDKQIAQQRLQSNISNMFQLANFQQQAQNNVKEAFNSIVAKVGYAGAYAAYASNPSQLKYIESIMGLGNGGLSSLASQPDLDRQIKQAQLSNLYSEINARNNPTAKPLTQAQTVAQGYAERAKAANAVISQLGSKFTGVTAIGGILPTQLQSSERQSYEQAKRQFINAVLRPESGASISPSEFDSASKEYFPTAGDSAAVVARKALDRQLKINSLQTQGATPSVAEAGQIIEYNGQQYTVGADGEMTPI